MPDRVSICVVVGVVSGKEDGDSAFRLVDNGRETSISRNHVDRLFLHYNNNNPHNAWV
jgi:hypothetical protein